MRAHREFATEGGSSSPPWVVDKSGFNVINGGMVVQLEAFQSGSDVTIQASFPEFGWPMLSTNLSPQNPNGSINMPEFACGTGGNTINYTNLQINLQANYDSSGQATNVYAALQLDVSVGYPYDPRGTVGASYILGF